MGKNWTVCTIAAMIWICSGVHAVTASAVEQAVVPSGSVIVNPPELFRIPSTIDLLSETPFYSEPGNPAADPVGTFAAQKGIQVLGGEYKWARGRSWWLISTYLGSKWISPEPWNITVPPPEKIHLVSETPAYASMDDTVPPTALLTPQEVRVTGAEKMWFYANSSDEKRWVRIQTPNLGEQWVHLSVGSIGYVKPADYYSYYGSGQFLLDDPNYYGPYGSMAGPMFQQTVNETLHVTGEYVNVYDTSYQVETEQGPKYIHEQGIPVLRKNEPLTLLNDTPLFAFATYRSGLSVVLHPQTVSSFEQLRDSNVYHVHTSFGDGWLDLGLTEPSNTVKTSAPLELKGSHPLYQFPFEGLELGGFQLTNVTVYPSAYWEDPNGTVWYLVDNQNAKYWIKKDPDHN
ncbi:hypothetical protein SK3146_03051 [Paenibacillus konkukensis]|uniref:Uncharacterized protein n=1 Tax=Paenibacillus konkukensis TaxID=2020716 RepID=A0ABY4RMZ1_9BACL|nr:hypothetical protein [Paenibacillus konkukensis]UQZ83844.1 hypothetical protein SK3146_03051 [Paenibacillus konkukensis]